MEDISTELEGLNLSKEENEPVTLYGKTGSRVNVLLDHCLTGKLLLNRAISTFAVRNAFFNAWKINNGISMEAIGKNLFLFKFNRILDKEWVARNGPWLFDKHLMIIEEPKANQQPSDLSFKEVAFWIRLLDVPFGFQNKEMARSMRNHIGVFLDVDCNQDEYCRVETLRMKVLIDITKPLRRGLKVECSEGDDEKWIKIRYERLPEFCYSCGCIGHVVRDCPVRYQEDGDIRSKSFQFENWLRFTGFSKIPRGQQPEEPKVFQEENNPNHDVSSRWSI